MVHQEQPTPPDSRPNVPRQPTQRVGIRESLIAPGEAAEGIVVRRSSTEDLFSALGLAGQAAGVLGEQAHFVTHQQRGVAIRQAKEELPGLLQDINQRELLIPNDADPGAHSRAIVDQRIRGSGMSKAAAQAYRDVLVPGLAVGFVREQQRIKSEQTSISMLFYKDALLQAKTAEEIQAILTEMRRELPDVPDALLLGIITEAGTAAANNGDMTRVDAVRAVLGGTNIEQQQKMIRTLTAVNRQRKRTNREDLSIRIDDLREQRRLGMPLNAVDKIMELWIDNPEIDFDEDDRSIQFSNFLIFDARISASIGDIDGVEEAMRLAKLDSTREALIPLLSEAQGKTDAVVRREAEEDLAQRYVQLSEGIPGVTFDTILEAIDEWAQDDRFRNPGIWQDQQLIRLEQRRKGRDRELLRQELDRESKEIFESSANDVHDALTNTEDFINAENTPDRVYINVLGEQVTISAETLNDAAYQMALDRIREQVPDPEPDVPLGVELEEQIPGVEPELARTQAQISAEAERARLRLQWLVKSRHVDRDLRDLMTAGAAENFRTITPDQVKPISIQGFQTWKELKAAGVSSAHTTVGTDAFYKDAQVAELHLKMTEAEALVAAGRPDIIVTTDPGGRPFIDEKTLRKAVANSTIGEAVTRDTLVFDIARNIISFRMRKYGITQEAATALAIETVNDDYSEINGYTVRTRDINLTEDNIKLISDLMIDFYLSDPKNAEIYDKDMLTIRHLETTGEIFVTRLNSGVPAENSPRISVREMAALGVKHTEATNVETAKIGSHKRLKAKVDDQVRRVDFRERAYFNRWADRNDSLETIRKKGRPGRLMMARGFWEKAFTDRTDFHEISQEFDPVMPAGTRQIVVDLVNHLNQNQKEAVRRATTIRVIPRKPMPFPIPFLLPFP